MAALTPQQQKEYLVQEWATVTGEAANDAILRLVASRPLNIEGKTVSLPESYKKMKFADLTDTQLHKVYNFWWKMTEGEQSQALKDAKAIVEHLVAQESCDRSTNVHSDEIIRLLFLHDSPDALPFMTERYEGMSRVRLDEAHSIGSGTWTGLADIFNNRDPDYPFNQLVQNRCVKYEDGKICRDSDGKPIMATPTNGNTYDAIFRKCSHLDPNSSNVRQRSPEWIKAQLSKVEAELRKIADNYHRSGNQDAEDTYDSWTQFCTNSPNWAYLAVTILATQFMTKWQYTLPDDAGRETGTLEKKTTSVMDKAEKYREDAKERQRKSREKRKRDSMMAKQEEASPADPMSVLTSPDTASAGSKGRSNSSRGGSSGGPISRHEEAEVAIANTVKLSAAEVSRIESLKFLAGFKGTSKKMRRNALASIVASAGLVMEDDDFVDESPPTSEDDD